MMKPSQPIQTEALPQASDDWRSEWGFAGDLADDSWLENLRAAEQRCVLGSIGEYELEEEVSRGGQGIVFRARRPGSERRIALKRMLAGSFATKGMRMRFQREVEAAALLNHPGIVSVYGMESDGVNPMFAMEWVDGLSATEWTRGREPEDVLEVFLRLADAVQHAHSRGVLHRDLKPSNVLIDSKGMPHVLDFGLAKFGDLLELEKDGAGLSKSAEVFGTPAYAAPEQLRGDQSRLDARADVYSLGVMLYEMLSGKSPYGEWKGINELLLRVGRMRPQALSLQDSRLGPDLDTILSRALAPRVELRYESVTALADDVRCYLEGRAIAALPTSNLVLAREVIRRNRLASCMALGLILLSTAFGWTLRRMQLNSRAQSILYREQGVLLEQELQRNAELLSFVPECLPENQDVLELFAETGVLLRREAARASSIPLLAGRGLGPKSAPSSKLSTKEKGELLSRLLGTQ